MQLAQLILLKPHLLLFIALFQQPKEFFSCQLRLFQLLIYACLHPLLCYLDCTADTW
jgi:hypothetical protein